MRVLCLSLQDDRYYVLLLLRCSIYLVHVNSRPLYRFQFLFWSVVRGSEKTPEKVEIASVKPVSATMKPITATKPASTTTSAATTTATSIAVKRKGDTPSTPHSKRARKDGSTSGWYSFRFFDFAEWYVIEFLKELLLITLLPSENNVRYHPLADYICVPYIPRY